MSLPKPRTEDPSSSYPPTESELLAFQQELANKEKFLKDQFELLDASRLKYETEIRSQRDAYSTLRREIEEIREAASQDFSPRTNRFDIPVREHTQHESSTYTVKQAVEFVPTFDGRSISVLQFVRACKRAREVIPASAERTLTKLICNKLRGRAYAAVEDADCCTISELCNRLKDILGPYKFVDQYRGELASILQGPSEHILDYITRVKDLRTAILDCHRDDPSSTDEVDQFAITCFIRGIIPILRAEIRPFQHDRISRVFDEAIAAYKQYELDKTRYREPFRDETRRVTFTEPRSRTPERREYNSFPRDNRSSRNYTPERREHENAPVYRESWRDRNSSYRQPTPPRYEPPQNRNREERIPRETRPTFNTYREERVSKETRPTSNTYREERAPRENRPTYDTYRENRDRFPTELKKTCKYCKSQGHDIHECRKREYNNRNQSGNERGLPTGVPQPNEAQIAKPQRNVNTTVPIEERLQNLSRS